MNTEDRNDLDLNIAFARAVLSLLVLVSWYVDPSYGGWFYIDETSLIILSLHLTYSVVAFVLIDRGVAASLVPEICIALDIAFAAAITLVTEGPTSPSWVFFVFAMIMIDRRASFHAAITVTICSSLVYFMLLAAFVPGPRNEYLMRLRLPCDHLLPDRIHRRATRPVRSARARTRGGGRTPCNRAYIARRLRSGAGGGEPSARDLPGPDENRAPG